MAKNLLFRLQKLIEWKLVVKVLVAAALIPWVWFRDMEFFPVFCFVVYMGWAYFSESQERKQFRASYLLLIILPLIAVSIINKFLAPTFLVYISALLLGVGLIFEFGCIRFLFENRQKVYSFFHLALILSLFFVFFVSPLQWLSLLFMFVALTVLLWEFFGIQNIQWRMRTFLVSIGLAFLATEIALLVRLMPLGFINATAFMGLFVLLIRDILKAHFEGHLTLSIVLRSIALFIFASIVIFAFSLWRV